MITEIWERFFTLRGPILRLRDITSSPFRSEKKSAIKEGKQPIKETWEMCFEIWGNIARPANITIRLFQFAKRLGTSEDSANGTFT